MHKILVNCLGGLSLPRKSVVRLTDRPNMTLAVYRGHKTTEQQQQQNNNTRELCVCLSVCLRNVTGEVGAVLFGSLLKYVYEVFLASLGSSSFPPTGGGTCWFQCESSWGRRLCRLRHPTSCSLDIS